jgi:lauroyl/myristoyl acyltransferase
MQRRWRFIPELILTWLAWGIIPLLPRSWVLSIARTVGSIAWRFSKRECRITRVNLDLVFGESLSAEKKDAIGRSAFQHFALTILDLFWFSRFTRMRFNKYVVVDSAMSDVLSDAPLIGVTGHIGSWEIISMLCGLRNSPMTAVAMPLANPYVDKTLQRLRMRTGSVAVPRSGAVRSLLRALRAGHTIGLVLDQNTVPSEGGIWVPFFGVPVVVSNAAGLLAVKTGTSLVTIIAVADSKGVYHFDLCDRLAPSGLTAEQITEEMTRRLEACIRKHPEAWLWSYKRWRYYRPGDDAERFPYYASCIAD